ncbi:methyltransferase domain-containing protein [Kiloniella litopenaei]|uniref:methyltransferase domain-containing protein n=1 Tax=Kiloniella litopenaei TaxID=1549748 RepID=UPI003BA96902
MSQEFFVRDDGSRVDFMDGLIEFAELNPGLYDSTPVDYLVASSNVKGGSENLDYEKSAEELVEKRTNISLRAYISRYNQVYNFHELMRASARGRVFENMLDIGCGYGIQPRIVKGLGLTKKVTGIDIYDRASFLDERDIPKHHRKMKFLRPLSRMCMNAAKKESWERTDFEESLIRFIPEPSMLYYTVFGRLPSVEIYNQKIKSPSNLDEMLTQNIYDLDKRYDLITSFTSIEWFQYEEILKKVSNILEDDGYYYMWWPNWWAPVTPNKLTGHFPWASQRLTKGEFSRYTKEQFGENSEHMMNAYSYFDPGRPTLSDYFRAATEVGLVPVGYEPIIHPWSVTPRRGVSYRGWAESGGEVLLDTLSDIQKERPDVQLSDLMSYGYAAVFKKVNSSKVNIKDRFRVYAEQEKRKPHNNLPFIKQMKPIARKLIHGKKG